MEKLKVLTVDDSSVMRKIVESFASGRVDIAAASKPAMAPKPSPKSKKGSLDLIRTGDGRP